MSDDADRNSHSGSGLQDAGSRQQALRWAALLTDREEPAENAAAGQQWLATWWSGSFEADCAALSAKLHTQSDLFMTTRFAQEVVQFDRIFTLLQPVLARLVEGECTFAWTMSQVMLVFSGDETQLLTWKRSVADLFSLARWTPAFLNAYEYLCCALPLGRADLDEARLMLLDLGKSPHRFTEARDRDAFDHQFLEFKQSYMDIYSTAHEDALRLIGTTKSKVDTQALHNLEQLSTFSQADKSYLNRVRVIGHWIRRNQCSLPARQILERHPRCYCNFNPARHQQPIDSTAQVNAAIREGIEHFRTILRKCKTPIIEELKSLRVDDPTAKQIASLLSRGPLVALNPRAIEVLNRVSEKYQSDFLAATRSTPRRANPATSM